MLKNFRVCFFLLFLILSIHNKNYATIQFEGNPQSDSGVLTVTNSRSSGQWGQGLRIEAPNMGIGANGFEGAHISLTANGNRVGYWGLNALVHSGHLLIDGSVGIGTTNPIEKLTVNGTIMAEKLKLVPDVVADYVFEPNFPLMPLPKLKQFLKEYKHLPGVPSEKEIKEKGSIDVAEFQMKLLENIEKLTLYIIKQDEKIKNIEQEIWELKIKSHFHLSNDQTIIR